MTATPELLSSQFRTSHVNRKAAAAFVNRVRESGGATMDIRNGRLANPGTRHYMVGGEPDAQGTRIPTHYVNDAEFNEDSVMDHWKRLIHSTPPGSRVGLGAWADAGNVELDASRITRNRGEAFKLGQERGEKAIWDNRSMSEIATSDNWSKS